MIGTNLSVWFSVLVQETKHTILTFYNPENQTLRISHRLGNKGIMLPVATTAHLRMPRGKLKKIHVIVVHSLGSKSTDVNLKYRNVK